MNNKHVVGFFLGYLLVPAVLLIGWVMNLLKIIAWEESMGMLVVRVIGAFIGPLGGVLGWL